MRSRNKKKLEIHLIGENPNFPKVGEIWRFGMPVPEWLSDRARIKNIDGESGELTLDFQTAETGEINILSSDGRSTLVTLKDWKSYLIYSGTHDILSVTEKQFKILYVK